MDDVERKAQEIWIRARKLDEGSYPEAINIIAAAIRDAEKRGMLRAAGLLREIGESHRKLNESLLESAPAMAEMQRIRAEECEGDAEAIERAAEIELLDDAKELRATDGEGEGWTT